METSKGKGSERLPTGRLIALSMLSIPISGGAMPLGTYLPAIYAQELGFPLAVLGTIFMIERIWGTFTDPLVGWLCDRTTSRYGRRKVWIAAGSVLFFIAFAWLFFPQGSVSTVGLTIALVVLYLAWSMIMIPWYAWSGELSSDYHERTRVATYQSVTGAITLFCILLLPALADWFRPGDQLLKLNAMGAAVLLPMIPGTVLALRSFPDATSPPPRRTGSKADWRTTLRAIASESTVLRIMFTDFAITFAQGIRGGLFLFFVTYVAGLPKWGSTLFLFQFVFGIMAAPLWQKIARRAGKYRALIWAELGQALVNCALVFVTKGSLTLLLMLTLCQGLMQGSGNLLLRSMLADVAGEHRLRTGIDRTAMLFSAFSISGKAGLAIPLGIALPLIAWYGFDPKAVVMPSSGLLALALIFSFGPGLAHLIAVLLIRGFSLDEDRQRAIRQEQDKAESRGESQAN